MATVEVSDDVYHKVRSVAEERGFDSVSEFFEEAAIDAVEMSPKIDPSEVGSERKDDETVSLEEIR